MSTHYGPWCFVNKVLLYHANPIHLYIVDGCFWTIKAAVSSYKKDFMTHKAKNFTIWPIPTSYLSFSTWETKGTLMFKCKKNLKGSWKLLILYQSQSSNYAQPLKNFNTSIFPVKDFKVYKNLQHIIEDIILKLQDNLLIYIWLRNKGNPKCHTLHPTQNVLSQSTPETSTKAFGHRRDGPQKQDKSPSPPLPPIISWTPTMLSIYCLSMSFKPYNNPWGHPFILDEETES